MAHARRSPQHRAPSSSISFPLKTRRNTLRRLATTRIPSEVPSELVHSPIPQAHRPVLVALQPNLRRLPSRLPQKNDGLNKRMRDSSHVITGSKRKRVVSGNENAHIHGRPTRGSGRLKRLRTNVATNHPPSNSEESQSEASGMEVDMASVQGADSEADVNQLEDEEENYDSSDDFLINSAPPRTLNRLLKHRQVGHY